MIREKKTTSISSNLPRMRSTDGVEISFINNDPELAAIFNKQIVVKHFRNVKKTSFGSSVGINDILKPIIRNPSNRSYDFSFSVDSSVTSISKSLKRDSFDNTDSDTLSENIPVRQINERVKQNDILLTINAITKKNTNKYFDNRNRVRQEIHSTRLKRSEPDSKSSQKVNFSIFPYIPSSIGRDSKNDLTSIAEKKISTHLYHLRSNRFTSKKVNHLRYRENVFRAATKLRRGMQPYPIWSYHDEKYSSMKLIKINVGGQIFNIFNETLSNLIQSKIATCIHKHESSGIPFFDRDYICFNAILNFYRTGRLHAPPNICLTFFEEELEFWGIDEHFIEPCCWSEYETFKIATNTLKKYGEDLEIQENFNSFDPTIFLNMRIKLFKIMTVGTGNIFARWISSICALFILLSIFTMIIGTSGFARVTLNGSVTLYDKNETVSNFLGRTKIHFHIEYAEMLMSGYFLSELIFRLILCPNRLELFSDTLNWVDLLATTTTILSNIFLKAESTGNFEGYMLLLKLPRIFRLFKLTPSLRSGVDAFTLTLRACANELKLILLLLLSMTTIFGCLIFVVEMVNESIELGEKSVITNVYFGMWWAIVTMTAVGFGDFVPLTTVGYLLGSITIMVGVMICQLPVPIVLKNFSVYNNQANARFTHKNKFMIHCADPESPSIYESLKKKHKKEFTVKKFKKMFDQLK